MLLSPFDRSRVAAAWSRCWVVGRWGGERACSLHRRQMGMRMLASLETRDGGRRPAAGECEETTPQGRGGDAEGDTEDSEACEAGREGWENTIQYGKT